MLKFPRKLIQAPLAAYSCAPFRRLAHLWGKPDFCCTEMLSAKHMYSRGIQRKRYSYKDPEEGLLCVQLSGNTPEVLAYAVEQMAKQGADLFDLNCGCPQPKIRKKNCGSQLLSDSKKLYSLIHAMKSVADVPVLVKIRVDSKSGDSFNQDVAKAIEDAGADAVTVHGRHWSEQYDVGVSYNDIAQVKQAISIPVIGNGDVVDTASAKKMFDETNCDAVMIARASVGQPWLFEKIYQELQGNVFKEPSLKDIGEIFLEHVEGLIELEGEKIALLQARSLGKYYVREHFNHHRFMDVLNNIDRFIDLEAAVKHQFVT